MALLNKTSLFYYSIIIGLHLFAINSSSIFSLEIDIISKPKTNVLPIQYIIVFKVFKNAIIEIEKIEIIHKTNPIILNLLVDIP
jgi:hypothetical protein